MNSKAKATYPLVLDANDAVSATYGITGIPETFVIDRRGSIAYVHIGQVTEETLREELSSLLGEEAP